MMGLRERRDVYLARMSDPSSECQGSCNEHSYVT